MPIDYSTDALLTSVKTRAMTADNQNTFSDTDIVRIASEELQSVLVPYIESVKQEYFVVQNNQAFVQGTVNYTMPTRATGMKLRDVMLIDNMGNQVNLPYINPENMKMSWAYAPYQFGFYPEDNHVVLTLGNLIGAANYSYVRMNYFRRPNTLCITSLAGQVLSIDTNTNEVTLDSAPTTWTTATTFDAVNSMPPFQSRGEDLTISNIAGFVLTFDTLPTGLSVGDWVSEANFSPIAQIPVECLRVLETLTAARLLQYSGDPAWQVFQAQADAQKKDLIQVLSPRVDGAPAKIPMRNRLWGNF
jgi:hypothetical protein